MEQVAYTEHKVVGSKLLKSVKLSDSVWEVSILLN